MGINKMPEFYYISPKKLAKMSEFYMIIVRKISFSRVIFFLGGESLLRALTPVSYAYKTAVCYEH